MQKNENPGNLSVYVYRSRYPSRIEKIDYEEGKMLVHFERWSHRYDEWIYWDSNRLRPLERPALRKEGLKDDEEFVVSGRFILSLPLFCKLSYWFSYIKSL